MDSKIDNTFKADGVPMRRFYLNRIKDETGVSRTGRVLEGVLTQSGHVITQWRPPHTSIGIYNSMKEFLTIHVDCHPSCSDVVWLDDEAAPQNPTDWYKRGYADCGLDDMENAPFQSIGGLGARKDPAKTKYPLYVSDSVYAAEYIAGYCQAAREMYGKDWRSVEFRWQPALSIETKRT